MEQLYIFNKKTIFIMFLLLLLLTGCESDKSKNKINDTKPIMENISKTQDNMAPTNYYSISFVDTSNIKNLDWSDKLSFEIPQIKDMSEERLPLEDAINQNIIKALTSWIGGEIFKVDSVDLTITCHSTRYLSFVNSFTYDSNHVDVINDYVTIDMLTGQRVYLNDLVEINEDFAKYLQENLSKVKEPPQPLWQGIPDLNKYTSFELMDELIKCSYTQEELIQNGYYSIEESIGSLLFRNSFFLRDGMLVIIIYQGGESFVTLNVNDIEHYLKVNKW
ncbi:hypothetical protein BXY41_104178 [Lacrimispora xylanisolvens]|uniref:Uncharacterized protein n=1 Tax=Lacrimispora xylanisolvens TaxID=384636 RepID=A0A2S6HUA7_9FIRM|nr:hypothetical protein [Hungatella xylanolytica]PPK81376.1 hypothetical protein BXY41_104178 [Hungatella xylanolytica]